MPQRRQLNIRGGVIGPIGYSQIPKWHPFVIYSPRNLGTDPIRYKRYLLPTWAEIDFALHCSQPLDW